MGPKGDPGEIDYNRVKQIVADLTEEFKEELAKLKAKEGDLADEMAVLRKLRQRLDPALYGLAAKVAAQSRDGSLKTERLEVVAGIVTVAVWLTDDSDASLAKLKALGFEVVSRNAETKMVLGKIKVDNVERLALADPVRRVEPPPLRAAR